MTAYNSFYNLLRLSALSTIRNVGNTDVQQLQSYIELRQIRSAERLNDLILLALLIQ